ncbi:MAG: SAM-dependent methyltransferase, partial [Desulfamplus sp.]|nr:SAM-dependent methyltransferase [Desulfamplus sp.]
MAFDQTTRNRLQRFVTDARTLLSDEFTRQLQNEFGLNPETGEVSELCNLNFLDDAGRETAGILRETMDHYLATTPGAGKKEVLSRIVREQAFTILNRMAALRMAEARGILMESIGKGYQSQGFQLYSYMAGSALGESGDAYRHYIFSIFDEFALDLKVLFDRFSPQGRLFPKESKLLELLDLINHTDIEQLWAEDETIGWIYQYFNSKEERKKMRDASQAPRNSRELAVRNQFFTPRYVVEFLTDNTLGRIWYEMTQGQTSLTQSCRYLVRRPNEFFLKKGEKAPESETSQDDLSQEELLKEPVHVEFRKLKDPRDIKMLDPACGSMHFGLYAFDLFDKIYDEAWDIEASSGPGSFERGKKLKPLHESYESKELFLKDVPRLIIENNIHGVDIDPRAVQIAGLSLWLRAQKSWHEMKVNCANRPQVQKSNIVCA